MTKKVMYYTFVFFLTIIVVFGANKVTTLNYTLGYGDYMNIVLSNTKTYNLYNLSNYNVINMLFYITMLISGVVFISEKAYTNNNGFRSMAVIRYPDIRKYLMIGQRQNFIQSIKFVGIFFMLIILSIFSINNQALTLFSNIMEDSSIMFHLSLIFYIIKIILFLNIIEIWLTFLVLDQKFEFLLIMIICITSILLLTDVILGFSFVTFGIGQGQIIYITGYSFVYLLSLLFILNQIKSKELW